MADGPSMHRFIVTGVTVVACAAALAAQQPTTTPPSGALARAGATPPALAGPSQSFFAVIQGSAVTSSNAAIAGAPVRLRDIRFGRIIDSQTTDAAGHFTFRNVDPGAYVVELLGKDERPRAASNVINADAGQAISTIVRVSDNKPPGGFIHSGAPVALAVTAAAAAAGVLAITPGTAQDISPR